MQVTVDIPEPWDELIEVVAGRMGCDVEEAFGRAMTLAEVVTRHLQERGARINLISPSLGTSQLWADSLYGGGGTFDAALLLHPEA